MKKITFFSSMANGFAIVFIIEAAVEVTGHPDPLMAFVMPPAVISAMWALMDIVGAVIAHLLFGLITMEENQGIPLEHFGFSLTLGAITGAGQFCCSLIFVVPGLREFLLSVFGLTFLALAIASLRFDSRAQAECACA